jgi:apolipoprotein N-acyltransferase
MNLSKEHIQPWLNVIISSAILGFAIKNNLMIIGLFCVVVLYINERKLVTSSWIMYLSAGFIATQLLFLTTTWWFTGINAQGWSQSIGVFTPQQMLGGILIFASLLASLVALVPRIFLKKYTSTKPGWYTYAIAWSLTILAIELILSLAMSQITRGNGVPFAPSWNFWSIALLLPDNSAAVLIKSTFGFWGSSFFAVLLIAFSVNCVQRLSNIRKPTKHVITAFVPFLLLITSVLIVMLCTKVILNSYKIPNKTVQAVAVSADAASNEYLEDIAEEFRNNKKTIVVLPEYSSLLNPYPAGILSVNNKDYTQLILKSVSPDTTIVGTEDVYLDGKRYVASYALDSELRITKSRQKQFLVPGGEYVTPWVGTLLSSLDKTSVQQFSQDRGRYVLDKKVEIQNTKIQIGLGACSTVLTPYAYRREVSQGARILTSSISYEQFKKTPQYESYAKRFAIFNAQSLKTPFIISAFNGEALIIDNRGMVINKTRDGAIRSTVNLRTEMTLYGKLGDKLVVTLIFIITGSILLIKKRRNL